VLRGEVKIGNSVVIADWRCDWIGVGLAEKLALDGCHVRLAVSGTHAGQNLQMYIRDNWAGKLHRLGVKVIPYARLYGADEDTAYFHHMASGDPIVCEGMDTLVLAQGHQPAIALEESLRGRDLEIHLVGVDTLVLAQGHQPAIALEESLRGRGLEIHLVGDCLSPRTVEEAIYEGLMVARKV
jgi:pyruvate/2-oxoglutarate dehydrogenase complex dihydrolipoamide dehydrogenase (E3) component